MHLVNLYSNMSADGVREAPAPTSVCDLIMAWARRQPDHAAVVLEDGRTVTYGQLARASTRLARLLQQHGVRPGDLVPVLATRSPEMVACFVGILQAGGCYVPLDAEAWDADRIASTLGRLSARVVICLGQGAAGLAAATGREVVISQDTVAALWDKDLDSAPLVPVSLSPSALAYIIFTSGTTATPKGVMIPHAALLNYVQQGTEAAPFNALATPADTTLLLFSPGFDACTGLVFSTLCGGAAMLIPATADFVRCMGRVTILTATPSVLAAVTDPAACPGLRTIVLGGEAPPPWLVDKWAAPERKLYNAYGPTETTVCSLMGRVAPGQPITLGQPMEGSRVYLVDWDRGQSEDQDEGEICISGPGLAVGYYQDPARTAQSFVQWQGERVYRTGDFGRRTVAGLVFAGRADSLVKNRGFLVNLEAEVVPLLLGGATATGEAPDGRSTTVRNATAFVHDGRLVAFVAPDTVDVASLRRTLLATHAAYLVPDRIWALAALPLTANGKADQRVLRGLVAAEAAGRTDTAEAGDSPKSSKLDILRAAVAAATAVPVSSVHADQSFAEAGGNSLAALKVLAQVRKKGYALGIRDLFAQPTLQSVCGVMEEEEEPEEEAGEEQETDGDTAMTPMQLRMVGATVRQPGANYQLLRIRLPAAVEAGRLRAAWTTVLARHSIFRTTFALAAERQVVRPTLGALDWAEETTTADQLEAVMEKQAHAIYQRIMAEEPADDYVPVNAFRLITVPGVDAVLLASAHHAQADGWSLGIVLEEVAAVLGTTSAGDRQEDILPPAPPPFAAVARAQTRFVDSHPAGRAFWTERLQSYADTPIALLHLPAPPSSPSSATTKDAPQWTAAVQVALGCTATQLGAAACRLGAAAPASLVYTAWALVLSSGTRSDRVAFGAVLSGRNLPMSGGVGGRVVGPLLNTVPFPVVLGADETSLASTVAATDALLLQAVDLQWSAAAAMAALPGDSLQGLLQTIVVTEYDVPAVPAGWTVERDDLMEFGLSLLVEAEEGEADGRPSPPPLRARLLYDSRRFDARAVQHLLHMFRNGLRALMDPASTTLAQVRAQLVDQAELTRMAAACTWEWDEKEASAGRDLPATVWDAFVAAAARWPDRIALESTRSGQTTTRTYRQLHDDALRVAAWLATLSVRGPVAVLADGSVPWAVAILAAFASGRICCAVDVGLPAARIEVILAQSGAGVLLVANAAAAAVGQAGRGAHLPVLVVDEFLEDEKGEKEKEEENDNDKGRLSWANSSPVYLLFTSGSTGIPKGVPLHNHSILNVISCSAVRLFASPGRRIAQMFGLGFDAVVVELFGTLCYGATLVLKDPASPFAHLDTVHATMATPSMLLAAGRDAAGSIFAAAHHLDTIALAGEAVPQALADFWADRVRLLNLYGPSECAPISTAMRLQRGKHVTVGRPLPGLKAYVLDHHGCRVPPGVTGQLFLSGRQMMRGYWRPEQADGGDLDRQDNVDNAPPPPPLVPNPFDQDHHPTMYPTGDLAYWDDEMCLCYVGRVDHQVKVHGFRIELEEIERALSARDTENTENTGQTVTQAAAIVLSDPTASASSPSATIVAFVAPDTVDIAALRARLAAVLPRYALPQRIVALETLPTSANGKTDRLALVALAAEMQPGTLATAAEDTSGLSATEQRLAVLWQSLLRLDTLPTRLDDFFAMGGNSLLAIRAARQLADTLGQPVPVALLLRETVLHRLAAAVDQSVATAAASFSAYLAARPSTSAPSSLEAAMYRRHAAADADGRASFNTIAHLVLTGGPVDTDTLARALVDLVAQHAILRARYAEDAHGQLQRVAADTPWSPQCYGPHDMTLPLLRALAGQPFALAAQAPLRAILWTRSATTTELVLVTHHMVTDKASLALMLQWVGARYQALAGEGASPLSLDAGGTYADWAAWSRQVPDRPQDVAFWAEHLQGVQAPLVVERREEAGAEHTPQAPVAVHALVVPAARRPYSQRVAVAATACALQAVLPTAAEEPSVSSENGRAAPLLLTLPYLNRDDPAAAALLGLFVDPLPVAIRVPDPDPSTQSTDDFLQDVTSAIQRAVAHRLPYAALLDDIPRLAELQTSQVLVLYQWQGDSLARALSLGAGVQVSERAKTDPGYAQPAGAGTLFPLLVECAEQVDGSLYVELEYDTRVLSEKRVVAVAALLQGFLQKLAGGERPVV